MGLDEYDRNRMYGPGNDKRLTWFFIGLLVFAWVIFPLVWAR